MMKMGNQNTPTQELRNNTGIRIVQKTTPTLTHISIASHVWDIGKHCSPQNAASVQGLHCLLTGKSIRNRTKMKKYTTHP